ncbi:MAG: carbohydrate-binding domain-containing protein [Lachnospiraceae bacterium]|nr:carbohydrate-binding domain-containing protein [Lachnospiraceae bacterium]
MKKNRMYVAAALAMTMGLTLAGCIGNQAESTASANTGSVLVVNAASENSNASSIASGVSSSLFESLFGGSDSEETSTTGSSAKTATSGTTTSTSTTAEITTTANVTSTGALDATDFFSKRDLRQTADLSEATYYTITDGQTITITAEGVYVLTGSAENAQIIVEAGDEDKVQLVLDGLTITNDSTPCIYVKSADKVFITTTESENNLTVTGNFTADGDTNTDAVIFSKDDLVLNGLGTVNISSTDNGITCKDDLKVTGGTWNITCASDAMEANDSIRIADGTINISSKKDGLHCENDEDDTVGYVYICGGTLNVNAKDDGIHAETVLQIDDGDITVSAAEGLEGTYVQVNGGDVTISATDDGINGARKSSAYTATIEVNGGYITIAMGQGDTDAVDANGYIYVNGGTLDITGQSAFDYDMGAQYNGGTIIVNGTVTNTITNQMMGGMGGMMGGMGGQMGGMGGRR